MDKIENKSLPMLYSKNSIQRVDSKDLAVIKKHGLQISKLKKDDPVILITAVSAMIESIYTLVNVGKQINADAIIKLAEMIVDNYWHLKIDELDIIFKKGIMGHYGKIYDRVDASVIFDWIKQYETSEEVICIYEQNSNDMAILAAEVNMDNPKGWTPPKARSNNQGESSILENKKFRDALRKIVGKEKPKPVDDGKSNEEHKANIRAQAALIMKNNEPKNNEQ